MRKIALMALGLLLWGSTALAMDVTLVWDPNSETDLAGYKVYYGENSSAPFNGTGASNGASPQVVPLSSITPSLPEWTVRGLNNLKKYYFAATAYDAGALESGYSNIVTAGPIQYILTTTVSGTGGTIAPVTGAFAVGQVVALTAAPGVGYRVRAWTGTADDASKATSNLVTMTAAKTVSVSFELAPAPPETPKNLRVGTVIAANQGLRKDLLSDPIAGAERVEVYSTLEGKWTVVPYVEEVRDGKTAAVIVKGMPFWTGTKGWYVQAGNTSGRSAYKYIALTRSVAVSNGAGSSNGSDNTRWQ